MQTVREGDTLWSYWLAVDDKGQPIDLSATTVTVHVVRQDVSGQTPIVLPAEVVDATGGRFRHKYDTLDPGIYFLEAEFDGPPGIGTAPTAQNALLRVVAQIA